jgi:hypothetical protein
MEKNEEMRSFNRQVARYIITANEMIEMGTTLNELESRLNRIFRNEDEIKSVRLAICRWYGIKDYAKMSSIEHSLKAGII